MRCFCNGKKTEEGESRPIRRKRKTNKIRKSSKKEVSWEPVNNCSPTILLSSSMMNRLLTNMKKNKFQSRMKKRKRDKSCMKMRKKRRKSKICRRKKKLKSRDRRKKRDQSDSKCCQSNLPSFNYQLTYIFNNNTNITSWTHQTTCPKNPCCQLHAQLWPFSFCILLSIIRDLLVWPFSLSKSFPWRQE